MPAVAAKLLNTRELAAELARRFMTEEPYGLIGLIRVRSGGELPPKHVIRRCIDAFALAQKARGVKTIRDAKFNSLL